MPNGIEQLTDALRDNKVCRTVSTAKIDIYFATPKNKYTFLNSKFYTV